MIHSPFSTEQRDIVVLGADGQIGQAIANRVSRVHAAITWPEIAAEGIENTLRRALSNGRSCDFVFATGLTDPRAGTEALFEANFEFPKRVIQLTSTNQPKQQKHRYLTIGTIHERFPALCASNHYFESKHRLMEWMQQQPLEQDTQESRFLHLQLHTVYGGPPKPHMFLGQMVTALRERQTFKMSSGEQLREYHHVDDVADAIGRILSRNWDFGSVIDLSSGRPIRLRDLAQAVFETLGSSSLLEIGAMTAEKSENREQVFDPSPQWLMGSIREPISGVVEYVRQSVKG